MMKNKKRPFSRGRRNCIRAGVSAVTVSAAGGVALSGALRPSALQAAPVDCVKSPWAYYPFVNGSAQRALDYGNEALPSMQPVTNEPGQWAVSGAWRGNGIDAGLEIPWFADPVGMQAVMLPRRGAYLIGALIAHGRPMSNSAEVIFRAGQQMPSGSAQVFSEVELKINVNGRAMIDIYDDLGQRRAISIVEKVPETNNGLVAIFAYIDHRPNGEKLVRIYQYIPGTTSRTTRSKSIATLGDISGGPETKHKVVNVGMRRNGYGQTLKHFNGSLSRIHVINFGGRPPIDIDTVLDGLSLSHLAPGPFLENI